MGWKREEQEVDLPLARVLFDYAGAEVGWQDGRAELNHVKDNRLLVLPRDTLFEVQMIERLNALGLQPLGPTGLGRFAPENCRQDFTFEEDEDDDVAMRWVEFNHADLPKLARRGLAHHVRRGLSLSRGRQADDAWKVDINDSGIDWFDLDLGIEVDGERVALLPILLDLFDRAPEELSLQPARRGRRGPCLRHPARRPAPAHPGGPAQGDAGGPLRAVCQPQDPRRRHAAPVARRDDPADHARDRAAGRRPALDRRRGPARHGAPAGHDQRDPGRRRTQGPQGDAAPLPGGRLRLAAVPERPRPVRRAGRRHGPGQDRAGAGAHPGREGGRAADSARA